MRSRRSGASVTRSSNIGRPPTRIHQDLERAGSLNTRRVPRARRRRTRSCSRSSLGGRSDGIAVSVASGSLPDAVWSAQGTTPDAIESALRGLVKERHGENGGLAPSRALNMIVFVESAYSGEIANRLASVGRDAASPPGV